MTAQWYNNHENLFTLAEWLRENRGWEFCKQNLLDVIETPWSWDKEWRLASGAVHFVERHAEDVATLGPNTEHCAWCDVWIGYVRFVGDDGSGQTVDETEWVVNYHDDNTGDLACDDCAGTAANFAETTAIAEHRQVIGSGAPFAPTTAEKYPVRRDPDVDWLAPQGSMEVTS